MSDSTNTSQEGTTEPQGEGRNESQSADGSQFTQEEFNRLVAREKRELRAKYADYDDLKAKAAQLDAIEEAKKSELEKAQEERDGWKAKYEELNAKVERRDAIDKAAAEYKVDAVMLSKMAGDVEENAKFLAERADNAPKYPTVSDEGERAASSIADLETRIASEKDPAKRVQLRAELIAQTRK
jgi:hypothetical protein